jgi:proteasome ATPase
MNSKYDIDYLRAFAEVLAAGNPNTKSMYKIVGDYYDNNYYDNNYSALGQAPKKKESTMFERDFREENTKLRDKLSEASSYIKELEGFIGEVKDGPSTYAYVIQTHGNRVTVSTNNGIVEVPNTPKIEMPNVGDSVIFGGPGIIIGPAQEIITGDLFVVSAHNKEEGWAEISVDGSPRRVVCSIQVEDGDRVLVDTNNTIALKNYGQDRTKFSFDGDTGVQWDDIGGLESAKIALKEAIELPSKHPDLFKKYNKRIPKGVMLYGPTGTGKTLLAKAAATSLASTHGKSAKSTGFIYVKGPELLSMWVGNTEAEIRGLFARGRDHFKKNGYPAILFIDEADALLGARGGSSHTSQGTLANTIVPQFLSEMDGLEDSGVFVLLATNRPDVLDAAVTRDGRIDRKVAVLRPNENAAKDVLRIHMKNRPVSKGTDLEILLDHCIAYLYGDKLSLYELTYNKTNPQKKTMFLRDLVNGAMIAGIAERAASIAMHRDIENAMNGVKEDDGISISNIYKAIDAVYEENLHTNHDLAIREFSETLEGDIINIQRV